MPRAETMNFREKDVALAREYMASASQAALGVKLEVKDNILVNPVSGMTYSMALLPGRANNCMAIAMDVTTGIPIMGAATPWIAALDAASSELFLIPMADLYSAVCKAAASGDQFQGIKLERGLEYKDPSGHVGQMVLCHVNHGWAEATGLIKKTTKMDKGGDTYQYFRSSALKQPEKFCHLHVHSYYSMLDGVSSPEEIVEAAYLNGQPGVALTDHGNMMGTFKFWKASKEYGIKAVMGCEVYVVDDSKRKYVDSKGNNRRFEYHQTLLAMNQQGWENLCELVSSASRDNYYYVMRTDHASIFKHKEGIICLSGCFKGMVAHHLTHFPPEMTMDCPWLNFNPDWARKVMQTYKDEFGDRYYCELQSNNFARYMDAVPRISQMADELGVPKVITNDAHFTKEEEAIIQQLMNRISSSKDDDGADGQKSVPYYLKCRDEITHPLFMPDMYDRTVEIMDRCSVDFSFKDYLFPAYAMDQDKDWQAFQTAGWLRNGSNKEYHEHSSTCR